jgi:hypothetical protein
MYRYFEWRRNERVLPYFAHDAGEGGNPDYLYVDIDRYTGTAAPRYNAQRCSNKTTWTNYMDVGLTIDCFNFWRACTYDVFVVCCSVVVCAVLVFCMAVFGLDHAAGRVSVR